MFYLAELAAKVAPTQRAHNRYRAVIQLLMDFEHEAVGEERREFPGSVGDDIASDKIVTIDGLCYGIERYMSGM